MLSTILEHAPDLINRQNHKHKTPFFKAVRARNRTMRTDMLPFANLSTTDARGRNVLHLAIQNLRTAQDYRFALSLLDRGIKMDQVDCNRQTPLHFFCVRTLEQKKSGEHKGKATTTGKELLSGMLEHCEPSFVTAKDADGKSADEYAGNYYGVMIRDWLKARSYSEQKSNFSKKRKQGT
mmetsp:Transcript_51079/g.84838  ORF Transcript_51079/g.84838 Transcript_51079/m.84838 type:complete len:180 (-) Transcript_51079:61-600(-)